MITIFKLIEYALGPKEAGKVDTAIPQTVFDSMNKYARQDIAGWYYAPECKIMGRLLTKTECWAEIMDRLDNGELTAHMLDRDVTYVVTRWKCFQSHVEAGEITLNEAGK